MVEVSLCMIVKNEENVLARCLDSFRDLVEEIVIVDTGSTDRTKKIAARYTDRIYDFEWIDDFAAARNFAFSKTTKEYIYSADADEMIDEENAKKFLALKEAMEPEIEIVQMWYVNRHEFRTTENYEKDLRPKLFRRLRSFRWIDPVHESVALDPLVYDSDVEILHLPESAHAGRDFGVFLKTVRRGERLSEKLLHMYAQELVLAGTAEDLSAAREVFEEVLHDPDRSAEERTEACIILARAARLRGDKDAFFKYCMKNISMSPCAEICCELGQYWLDAGDCEEASIWYINASEETEAVLDAAAAGRTPLMQLSHIYEKLAGLSPEMKDACIRMAVEYRSRAQEA